jgi:heme A synthase
MFDLRLPSGIFFTIIGALLVIVGLVPANVNLYAGLSMLTFGALLLFLARRR